VTCGNSSAPVSACVDESCTACASGRSKAPQAIGYLPQDRQIADTFRPGPVNSDKTALAQIGDQDADNAGCEAQIGGKLNQRHRYLAPSQHSGLLGSQSQGQADHLGRAHHVNEVNALAGWTGLATGQCIGPYDGAGIAIDPLAAARFSDADALAVTGPDLLIPVTTSIAWSVTASCLRKLPRASFEREKI
jgi:hypothetical protein